MELPKNIQIFELPGSNFWFDENGILCFVTIKSISQSLEDIIKNLKKLKNMIGDNKVCLLLDVSHLPELTSNIRNYFADELPKFINAAATISNSEFGKMIYNLFVNIKKPPFPTKMFTYEYEAKAWLKTYL